MRKHFFLLGCLAFFACKSDTKQAAATGADTAIPVMPASPKPEVYIYTVAVDKLNLREQSNKNAKVIAQLNEGELVEGNGEISANKEEATLRNIPYNEPYFKVTRKAYDKQNGWAYSAALTPVYAGSRATLPDLGQIELLTSFLKTLDVKKLDSGKKAWDYVISRYNHSKGTSADAAFMLLERFLFRMEIEGNFYEMTEKIEWPENDYTEIYEDRFDMKKYPATRSLAENGFRLEVGEGMVFPVVDWMKMGDFFLGKVTPPMKQYLEQYISEQKDQLWSDGGIIIPLEKVADRAVWWEKFNNAHPYFVRSEETYYNEKGLLSTLIFGADNTPAFDYETSAPTEDFQKVWAYIRQNHAGTEVEKAIRELTDLIAAEGGKRTPKVEKWMEKYAGE
jgi:hypothetical protein